MTTSPNPGRHPCWPIGDVGIVVAGCEHGFEAGEVGTTAWDNMAGMEQLAIQFLDIVENVCGTCPPFCDCVGVFGLLRRAERYPKVGQVPRETDVSCGVTKLLVLRPVPQDAKPVRDVVNVVKVVCETGFFGQAGGVTGEVETGKVAVLIKFLEGTIFKDMASVPDLASLLVSTPIGDVLGPLLTSGIVFFEVLVWYAGEQMVINPTR